MLTVFLTPRAQCQNAGGSPPAETTAGRPAQGLPFLQDQIPAEYREFLPLPLGISLNYVHQDLPLKMVDTTVTIPGFPLPPGLVRGGTVKAVTNSYVARIDAWLLPFLNVYGVAGRFKGTAQEFKMDLAMPVPLPIPSEVSYKGSTYGAGFTAAFGYRHFFASYDCSWQSARPDLTNSLKTRFQGLRGGVHFASSGIQTRLYVGTVRLDILDRVEGTVLLQSGAPAIFDVTVQPKEAWSPVAGADFQLSRHFSLSIEASFGSMKQIVVAPGFRF